MLKQFCTYKKIIIMEKKSIQNPFLKEAFGQNPFEYKGDVYFFNPTVQTVDEVLAKLPLADKNILTEKCRHFFNLPTVTPVIVGVIQKVFDDPFLGGVEAEDPANNDAQKQAEETNEWLTEMNGIDFHRQYYQFMVKDQFEFIVKLMTGGKKKPEQLEIENFLYAFCINFFARHFSGHEESIGDYYQKVSFFKKVLDDLNSFEYVLLENELPTDRAVTYFLVWEK